MNLSASERRGAHAMLGEAEALARLLREATRGRLSLAVTAGPAVLDWRRAHDAVDGPGEAGRVAACGERPPHGAHEHDGGLRWCDGR